MDTVLSIMMLAALALLGGAFLLWRRGGAQKQISLMVILAVVMIANVLMWAIPYSSGPGASDEGPLDAAEALGNPPV